MVLYKFLVFVLIRNFLLLIFLFFHLIRKDHWKNLHGPEFIKDKNFLAFQNQRLHIWQPLYVKHVESIKTLPPVVFSHDNDITEDDKRLFNIEKAKEIK